MLPIRTITKSFRSNTVSTCPKTFVSYTRIFPRFLNSNPFWSVLYPEEDNPINTNKARITKEESQKTIFFGAVDDPIIDDPDEEKEESNTNFDQESLRKKIQTQSETSEASETTKQETQQQRSASDFFRPTKDATQTRDAYNYSLKGVQTDSPMFLFGSKENDMKVRKNKIKIDDGQDGKDDGDDSVSSDELKKQAEKAQEEFFKDIDLKINRIHGAYYRVTPGEVERFEQQGFIVLPNSLVVVVVIVVVVVFSNKMLFWY